MTECPNRALFVVSDLRVGGAERHLITLLPRIDPARFTTSVVCIGGEGGLFAALPAAGIKARALHLGGKRNLVCALMSVLSNPRAACRMGRAGRRRVEAEFSLDRSVAAAKQAIEDVVFGHGVLSESAKG